MTHEKVLQNFVGYNSWFSTCLLVTQVCVIILTFEYQAIHIYVMRGDIFISYRLRTICGNWDTTMRSTTPPVRLEHNKKGLSRTEDAPHGMQRYLIISILTKEVFTKLKWVSIEIDQWWKQHLPDTEKTYINKWTQYQDFPWLKWI